MILLKKRNCPECRGEMRPKLINILYKKAQGALLAQMSRLSFERLLGERKIPWAGTIDDVKRDLEVLNSL